MEIEFGSKRIRKVCTTAAAAEKEYGHDMAAKIQQRISEIRAADTVEQMIQYRIGRCHALKGNKQGQYAVDLVHPQRLIFTKKGIEVQVVNIIDIDDYH